MMTHADNCFKSIASAAADGETSSYTFNTMAVKKVVNSSRTSSSRRGRSNNAPMADTQFWHSRQTPCQPRRPHQQIPWLLLFFSYTIIHLSTSVVVHGASVANSTFDPVVPIVPITDNSAATHSWRRIGGGGTNNEQELIDKILRDDTASVPKPFPYSHRPPSSSAPVVDAVTPALSLSASSAAAVMTDDTPVTKTVNDRQTLVRRVDDVTEVDETVATDVAQIAVTNSSSSSNGKINQQRSKEEQEAFNNNQRQGNAQQFMPLHRRKRRAVNSLKGGPASTTVNSNFFVLKSIVTEIDHLLDYKRNKCNNDTEKCILSTSDIPQLLRGMTISEKGNDNFHNVRVLNMSASGLSQLPHSTVEDIVAKLPNIGVIDLSINQLKTGNVVLSGRLTALNFSQNQLTHFQLRHGSSSNGGASNITTKSRTLACLDLSHNNLTGTRRSIVLWHNQSSSANITMLDLSHNQITGLTFLQRPENRIGKLKALSAVESFLPLRVLILANNQVRSIGRDTFVDTPHLQVLSLAHNLVANIENDTFAGLQKLQYLDLGGNQLNRSSIRALQGIPDLIGLSLARNPHLGDAALQGFVASWSLKELDISATGLCHIPAALAQSVRTLNLAHNHFEVIRSGDLDSYPLLYNLDLSHCNITEIEDDALGRLEMLATLNLNGNHLRQVPISLPENLIVLHLEHNHIVDLQASRFVHLVNLRVLSLSGNKIQYLPALPLRKLLVLNLASAELHGLSQLVVQTSPHLKDLRLDNNPVKCADLLGIAEWASPCRDVGSTEPLTPANDYQDLADDYDDMRELYEEQEKDNLKTFLDYMAAKTGGENQPHQLPSEDVDVGNHRCRSSSTTASRSDFPSSTTQRTSTSLPPVTRLLTATLATDNSKGGEAKQEVVVFKNGERETDTVETEQISSNLANPQFQQTVTVTEKEVSAAELRSSPSPRVVVAEQKEKTKTTTDFPTPRPKSPVPTTMAADRNKGNSEDIMQIEQRTNEPLQTTGHLNSNKRNDRDDVDDEAPDAVSAATVTNVNDEEESSSSEILSDKIRDVSSGERSPTTESAHLSMATTTTKQDTATSAIETEESNGKSSESVPIKLVDNKTANSVIDNVHGINRSNRGSKKGDESGQRRENNNNYGNKNQVSPINNKKSMEMTDSSKTSKLKPLIEERNGGTISTGRIFYNSTSSIVPQQQQRPPIKVTTIASELSETTTRTPNNRDIQSTLETIPMTTRNRTQAATATMAAGWDIEQPSTTTEKSKAHHTSTSATPVSSSSGQDTTTTAATPTQFTSATSAPATDNGRMSLMAVSSTESTTTESFQTSSKQIISRLSQQIETTPVADVHNLRLRYDNSDDETATTSPPTKTSSFVGKVVNESGELMEKLPQTARTELATTTSVTESNVILRNEADDEEEKHIANDKQMKQESIITTTTNETPSDSSITAQQLIEGVSDRDKGDVDDDYEAEQVEEEEDAILEANPLLKLWQQSTAARNTQLNHKTNVDGDTMTGTLPGVPGILSDESESSYSSATTTTSGGRAGDVNEGRNLIRAKSESNRIAPATTRSLTLQAGVSLKSETILINDENKYDKHQADIFAGGESKRLPNSEDLRQVEDVLKLIPKHSGDGAQNGNSVDGDGTIYVAENSLHVAELVLPATHHDDEHDEEGEEKVVARDDPPDSETGTLDRHRNSNNGATNRRFDKLSQLNKNSIHATASTTMLRRGGGEGDTVEARALNSGVLEEGMFGRRPPWNEPIKDDGRRNKKNTNDENDNRSNGIGGDGENVDSDNYHHRQPHPGLFIVIGATMGIVLSIGLFRYKRNLSHPRHYPLPHTGPSSSHGYGTHIRSSTGGGGATGDHGSRSDINQMYADQQPNRNVNGYRNNNSGHEMHNEEGAVVTESNRNPLGHSLVGRRADNFSSQPSTSQNVQTNNDNEDHYRCTNWQRRTVAADNDKCDEHFVDVQLTSTSERKSVNFDLLPMKFLSANDQPSPLLHPIMTSDCDYDTENNGGGGGDSSGMRKGCDMRTPYMWDKDNKSCALDRW